MSFSDTIFLFFLALILFGPKKLPEMARQAGRLLNELRRASNEFKSQIETEIAHLEVQKEVHKDVQKEVQQNLPSSPTPPGTVPSLSLNPVDGVTIPHTPDPSATLAAPTSEALSVSSETAHAPGSTPATEAVVEASDSASQASH